MKKAGIWLLALMMMLCCLSGAAADLTVIEPNMDLALSKEIIEGIQKANPEEEGICPLTGLPMADEPYTPVAVVLDDSPEVFPHWGVADADWIVQVPLRKEGATRFVAVYGGAYPEQVGGVRSARMTTLPIATLFTAAAASGAWPPNWHESVDVEYWLNELDYNKPIRYYNLLGTKYRERVDFLEAPWNLSAHVQEMHQSLAKRTITFDKRFFVFADEPTVSGDDASFVRVQFFGSKETKEESGNSACTFTYTEGEGYTRDSKTGLYADRDTGDVLAFANVIMLRSPLGWEEIDYPFYKDNLKGCGQVDIFQNGRHITGAWYRKNRLSRLVLLDEAGQEIPLQRGKTFMVVGDEYTVVSYE